MTSPKKPGDAAPPSLFSAAQHGAKATEGPAEGLRMLSGLDTRPADKRGGNLAPTRQRRSLKTPVLAAALVVIAAGAVAWQFFDSSPAQLTTATATATASPVPVAAALPRASASAPAAEASAVMMASASTPASAAAPAAIETVAVAAASEAASAAPPRSSPFASLAASEPMALPASGAALARSSPRAEPAARSGHPAAAVTKTASKSSPASAKVAANSASGAGSGRDSDVDLLAAIVTHLDGSKATPATKTATSRKTAEAPSVAQLVQKCKKLSSKDEARCRRQVCEGSWGKVQACPSKLAPAKAVAEEQSEPHAGEGMP